MPETDPEKKSTSLTEKKLDFNSLVQEIGKAVREINTLPKLVEKTVSEMLPKLYKDNIDQAYADLYTSLAFIMRHLY